MFTAFLFGRLHDFWLLCLLDAHLLPEPVIALRAASEAMDTVEINLKIAR